MTVSQLQTVSNKRECALSVDFVVRSGTANVFSKQQQFRCTWVGASMATNNVYLQANNSQTVYGPMTTIILSCEGPVRLTYIDPSTGSMTSQVCTQLWIADIALDSVTIQDISCKDNAVVVTTVFANSTSDNSF